jgi:hypothetical protein
LKIAELGNWGIGDCEIAIPQFWQFSNFQFRPAVRGIFRAPPMDPKDLERIAKTVLRELGAGDLPLTISAAGNDQDCWHINVGGRDPHTLTVRAGAGTTANFVREQIFTQFSGR